MSLQTWQETLIAAQVDSTAITNTVTRASLLPPAAIYTLPANFYSIGKTIRFTLRGRISNVVTTPGTLTIDVTHGATLVFAPAAISLNVVAKTNVSFELEIDLTCRAIGTTGSLIGGGHFTSESVVGATANAQTSAGLPLSAPATGNTFDTTLSQTVNVFATFSVSTATTSIQTHQYTLESLN